jgi:hypothetical protein
MHVARMWETGSACRILLGEPPEEKQDDGKMTLVFNPSAAAGI